MDREMNVVDGGPDCTICEAKRKGTDFVRYYSVIYEETHTKCRK
jgi:hypothetical protein